MDEFIDPHGDRGGKAHHLWIQRFKVPAGGGPHIAEMIDLAGCLGVPNITVWGFNGCAHMSATASNNPEATWQVVTENLRWWKAGERIWHE